MGVQKHVKKCFEGIKTLKLLPPSSTTSSSSATTTGASNKTYEATVMLSPDGETAPFAENVVIDGAVELWLVYMYYISHILCTAVAIICQYILVLL